MAEGDKFECPKCGPSVDTGITASAVMGTFLGAGLSIFHSKGKCLVENATPTTAYYTCEKCKKGYSECPFCGAIVLVSTFQVNVVLTCTSCHREFLVD